MVSPEFSLRVTPLHLASYSEVALAKVHIQARHPACPHLTRLQLKVQRACSSRVFASLFRHRFAAR